MSALTTTFKELHGWGACRPGYRKLAKGLGGIRTYGRTTPVKLSQVLDICGIEDCFWVLDRATLDKSYAPEIRLLICDYAELILPIFEDKYPGDSRPRAAIETARRFANGEATTTEIDAAWDAAWDAASWVVWEAAHDASYAARAALDAYKAELKKTKEIADERP